MSEGLFWGIVSVVVTLVVGVPVAVVIARRFSTAVVLRRAVSFERLNVLTERLSGGLTLTFRGRDLDSVSRTYLAMWHERGGAVRGSEVLASDPLRIEVDDVDEVLQVRVLTRSKELNELRVEERAEGHLLTFEYLDKLDGGVLEVLHTGDNPARIVGTIPGVTLKKPRKALFEASPHTGTVKAPRWWRPRDRRARRRLVNLVFAIMATLYTAAIGLFLAVFAFREPRLVDESAFDLNTISGQGDFALAITRAGSIDTFSLLALSGLFGFSIFLAVGLWVVFARSGGGVPKSILAIEASGVSKGSMDEIKRLLENGSELSDADHEQLRGVALEAMRLLYPSNSKKARRLEG